jgi:hypothetical protein
VGVRHGAPGLRLTAPKKTAPRKISYAPNSPKAIAFCERFLVHLNQTKAAEEAGYSKRRARQAGSDLMQLPEIQARIQQLLDARAERNAIDADAAIKLVWDVATANPNEIVEHRRECCRYCYGRNHDYQRTRRERAEAELYARAAFEKRLEPNPNDVFTFNEQGGLGWDPRKDPNPDCPECFGEGTPRTFFKDTRKLSPGALALYAGVKETKDGIELKVHSQADARTNIMRHLGLFKDTVELEAGQSLEALLAKSWGPRPPVAPGGHA